MNYTTRILLAECDEIDPISIKTEDPIIEEENPTLGISEEENLALQRYELKVDAMITEGRNIIFIAEKGEDYEGAHVLGIYSTYEKAYERISRGKTICNNLSELNDEPDLKEFEFNHLIRESKFFFREYWKHHGEWEESCNYYRINVCEVDEEH